MPADHLTVFIVDDDRAVRDSLGLMLGLAGYPVAVFNDAEAFLAASRPEWSGCLVADLRLPGASGIELQAALRARGSPLPVIIITAHGDVPTARAAFLADAVDFLEKPFKQGQLMDAIESAFAREAQRHARANPGSAPDPLAELTPREREVLEHAVLGKHAKEIAAALGISPRTVEVHKARVMAKLGARNVMELVRVVLEARRPGTES